MANAALSLDCCQQLSRNYSPLLTINSQTFFCRTTAHLGVDVSVTICFSDCSAMHRSLTDAWVRCSLSGFLIPCFSTCKFACCLVFQQCTESDPDRAQRRHRLEGNACTRIFRRSCMCVYVCNAYPCHLLRCVGGPKFLLAQASPLTRWHLAHAIPSTSILILLHLVSYIPV